MTFLKDCVYSFARIVYFLKPKAATLLHDINLKKLFTLKVTIWRLLRKAEVASTHLVI